jgi:acetolactate synthase regulatory subunit
MTVDGDNCVEPEAENTGIEMTVDGDNCIKTVESLLDKSGSLRSSMQKRLETEKGTKSEGEDIQEIQT